MKTLAPEINDRSVARTLLFVEKSRTDTPTGLSVVGRSHQPSSEGWTSSPARETKKPAKRRGSRKNTPTATCTQQESSASSAVSNGGLHPRGPKIYWHVSGVSTQILTQQRPNGRFHVAIAPGDRMAGDVIEVMADASHERWVDERRADVDG